MSAMIIQPQVGLVSKREGDYGIDATPIGVGK